MDAEQTRYKHRFLSKPCHSTFPLCRQELVECNGTDTIIRPIILRETTFFRPNILNEITKYRPNIYSGNEKLYQSNKHRKSFFLHHPNKNIIFISYFQYQFIHLYQIIRVEQRNRKSSALQYNPLLAPDLWSIIS